MKLFSKPKPRLTAVLLALIIVAGGIPFVVGSHVNDMLSPWREVDDEPTGNSLLDDALSTAANTLDSTLEHERIPRRDEPQVPATFFHDIFDPEDQIGGWGDWRPDDTQTFPGSGDWTNEERWHIDASAAGRHVQVPWVTPAGNQDLQTHSYDIDQGYRFGNGTGYPISDVTPGDHEYTFLVSPLINLQSLPVQLPDERQTVPGSGRADQAVNANGQGTIDLTQQTSGARSSMDGHLDHQDRIILYMDHKYNFANHFVQTQDPSTTDCRVGPSTNDVLCHNQASGAISGVDASDPPWPSVSYVQTPATRTHVFDWGNVSVLPEGASTAHVLAPLRGAYTQDNGTDSDTQGQRLGFSGAQLNFTEEAFDLTAFAGQDVRLVFQVATGELGGFTEAQYFGDPGRFQAGSDFFGWAISNVRVEGPAHLHNVRLDRVTHPSIHDPSGGLFAPTGTEPLKVLLLNRGRVTEDVVVRMVVDGIDVGECTDEVLVKGLEPGASAVVDFVQDRLAPKAEQIGCLDIGEGDEFKARFEAEILARADDVAPRKDLYAHDNELAIDVTGQGPDIRPNGRMVADPALDAPRTPITLNLPMRNQGASDADVDLALSIDRRHPTAADFDEPDVHLDPSLVQFADGSAADQTVHLPGLIHGSADWSFSVMEAGLYRVTVEATGADGRDFFTAEIVVGAFMAPEFAYEDRFDGIVFDDNTAVAGGWTPEAIGSAAPPCATTPALADCLEEDQRVVWELAPGERRIDVDPCRVSQCPQMHSALRGEFDAQAWLDDPAALATSVSDVEVEVLYYAEDLRCTGAFQDRRMLISPACDVPSGWFDVAVGGLLDAPLWPENRLSVRLAVGEALTGGTAGWDQVAMMNTRFAELRSVELQHVGGSHYRNAYQSGQWLRETYDVSVSQLLGPQVANAVPAANLTEVALEFVLESRYFDNPPSSCIGDEKKDASCPTWRVAEASMRGLPADGGAPLRLLHWTGVRDEPEQGKWFSYAYPIYNPLYERPVEVGVAVPVPQSGWSCPLPEVDTAAATGNPLACPIWTQRPVQDLSAPHPPTWANDEASGYWTNAEAQEDLRLGYTDPEGGAVEHLTSPRFRVPDSDAPTMTFDHRFQFAPSDLASYADSGMLLVRFYDADGDEAATPFLPVYLDHGRFMSHDCQNHYGADHPDSGSCQLGLLERNPMRETFDLRHFPLLDYRNVRHGHGGMNTGYGLQADGTPIETGDVSAAFRRVDLRYCTAEGRPILGGSIDGAPQCVVQFAFRLEIPDPEPFGPGGHRDRTDAKQAYRNQLTGMHDAEGWFLDSFRIMRDDVRDFDLALTDVEIKADYDVEELGFGPGTDATAVLTVRNEGRFTVTDAEFHLTVQDPLDGTVWRFDTDADLDFALSRGEQEPVNIEFTLPEDEGHYRFALGVDIQGDRIPDELALVDGDPTNDCLLLSLDGTQQRTQATKRLAGGGCDLSQAATVPVVSNPRLGLEMTVTPEAGRAGEEFPRELDIRIENTGNTVVKDALLKLAIQRAADDAEAPQVFRWVIPESPLPGHSKSWTSMPLQDIEGDPASALTRIVMEEHGTYFVTASLLPSQDDQNDGHDWEVVQQTRLDAFDTIYADTFGSTSLESDHPSMVAGDEMVPLDSAWQNAEAQVPDVDGDMQEGRVWRFGDAEIGQYPAGADAHLEFPAVDLSSARHASLSISHRYDLETGYDGARVEASLDGGKEWSPLHPRGGYPATVAAENPLNEGNDPTEPAPGFTGDSLARNPLSEGWVIDEFDLASLPGFTTQGLLEQFDQDGFDRGPHIGGSHVVRVDDGPVTYHPDWKRPGTQCGGNLESCWSRENANWQKPAPLHPGGEFWWSGSAGGTPGPRHPGTETRLTLDLDLEDDERVRLLYSSWKDDAGRLTVTVDGDEDDVISTTHDAGTDGWVENVLAVPPHVFGGLTGDTVQVRFRYTEQVIDEGNRGAAIDDVRLEVYRRNAAGGHVVTASHDLLVAGQIPGGVHVDPIDSWGWRATPQIPPTEEAWGIDEVRTRQGEEDLVWRFGTEYDPENEDNEGRTNYPGNAHERLVTPRIDLGSVAGESAYLESWWKYDMRPNDQRRVLVQVVEPTADGRERLSEWQPLPTEATSRPRSESDDHSRCSADRPAWCPVSIDIKDYIGQVVRFAFEVETTRLAPEPAPLEGGGPQLGWTWLVDEVGVKADSLVGQPVQLRLRAATDASIDEGAWVVENVQLVGLTYETNAAILPNGTIRDRTLDAQEIFELSGLVRNLGPDPQRKIYLALSARANDEDVDPPEIRFLRDGDGEPEENVTHRIGPIFLGSAGATSDGEPLDRIPYNVQVTLPDAPATTQYRFTLEIQDEGGDVLDDKNLGDHLREFQVDIKEDPIYLIQGLMVDRPTLETVDQTARFSLPIDNTGSTRLHGDIVTKVERLADASGNVTNEDPQTVRTVTLEELAPGSSRTVAWEWTPGDQIDPGFYRVEASVEPDSEHGPQPHYAHVLVGGLPIYYVEDFAQDPFTDSRWTRSPDSSECTPTTCWRTSTVFQEHGGQSLFIGDDTSPGYPGHGAAQATTPGIDLSFLARDPADKESSIVKGQSPFKPYLSARYHPTLAGSDDVTVYARPGSEEYRELLTGGPLGGRSNDMHVASFPLFEEGNNVLGPRQRLLKDEDTSFRFDTGTWGGGDGFGFALDLLTISSYDVEVDPPRHDIDLRLGSDKVFYFKVENTGAANDTYSVAIDSEGTADIFQSPVTTVEVLTPQITLDPGGSSLAEVRVKIPFQRMPDKFSGTEIVVSVTSGVDPNRVATGVIHVEDFIEADLADLVTDLRRPRGESGPVVEGEQATFIASITNHGDRASRETDLVVFACPTHRLDEEGKKVREISLSECSKEGLAVEIGAVPLASLTPSKDAGPGSSDHVSTRTFSWVPPLGSRGEYQVVAVADPRQVVVQFDRSSSTDSLDLEVAPIERPDVVVTGLRVTDALGNEVRQASAGETLHIEGTVENLGDAPAPNVKARIVNQFNLRDERIGDLNPGASRTLDAQWVAQPGNWVILFEGTTSAVEIDSSNNAKRWSLAVRSGSLQANWDPQVVHVDPGETTDAVLRVDNHRDNPADLMVSVSADQFSLSGVPGSIFLARGASTELPVAISASPFAESGRHSVDVDLMQRDTGAVLASTKLEVHVGADRDVRLTVDPVHSPPGTASLPLVFKNGGDASEAFTVRLDGPEDWTVTVLQPSIRLEAGASREVQAILEIPPGTPAGRYEVSLDAEVLQEVIAIDVVEQPVWRSDVKSVHSLSDHVEVLVAVENVGNARAAPPFLAEETYSINPTPRPHEPGESRTYHLRIQTTDGVASVALPGHGVVPVELRPERPDVEMTRFEVQSSGVLQSGDRLTMRLQVRGDEPQIHLPVDLLVDGVLLTGERVDLDAGETQDVMLTWQVEKPGKRVVTAVMGSGDATVARTIVLDVEHASDAMIPGPGPVVILALVGVVAVLRRRRDT